MSAQRRPIGPWHRSAALALADVPERLNETWESFLEDLHQARALPSGPWIHFDSVPMSDGRLCGVSVLLSGIHETGRLELRGIRLDEGHLTAARLASLPLDALLKAAARARRDLIRFSVEEGERLPDHLQPSTPIAELRPHSDEHLAAVARTFREAKQEKRHGAAAVAAAGGVTTRQAEKWVRWARERFEETSDPTFYTGTKPRRAKADTTTATKPKQPKTIKEGSR